MSEWIETKKRKPRVPRGKRSVPVLIWPHLPEAPGVSEVPIAYYGKVWPDDKRAMFRIYGRQCWPTHWMPLPSGPDQT